MANINVILDHTNTACRDNVPDYLKSLNIWCGYRLVKRGDGYTKPPINLNVIGDTADYADVSNPSHCVDYATALRIYDIHKRDLAGLCVQLLNTDLVAIDIDHCINQQGDLSPLAIDVLRSMYPSYAELSPSKTGLHVLARGKLPRWASIPVSDQSYPSQMLEIFSGNNGKGHSITITGKRIKGYKHIIPCQQLIDRIYTRYVPAPVPTPKPQPQRPARHTNNLTASDIVRIINTGKACAKDPKRGQELKDLINGITPSRFASRSEAWLSIVYGAVGFSRDRGVVSDVLRQSAYYTADTDTAKRIDRLLPQMLAKAGI